MAEPVADLNFQWHAKLQLQLEHNLRGTHLRRCRHQGPLYVQKPFYPEGQDHAHIYLLHPPGGIVSGDTLEITVDVKENAGVLCTTPGANRIYHARQHQPEQYQRTYLNVDDNAVLEWFPMETIVYNGACANVETKISLGDKSRVCVWEITSFGLPAGDQAFDAGKFSQRYHISQKGLPIFIDVLAIDDNNRDAILNSNAGLQSEPVSGFFFVGPFEEGDNPDLCDQLCEKLRDSLSEKIGENVNEKAAPSENALIGITRIQNFICIRYLGSSTEQARDAFVEAWKLLRPYLFNRAPCLPRIWST